MCRGCLHIKKIMQPRSKLKLMPDDETPLLSDQEDEWRLEMLSQRMSAYVSIRQRMREERRVEA
jgi:hypothetical protein